MKKFFAILCVVMLLASLTVSALADNAPITSPSQTDNVPKSETEGITITRYNQGTDDQQNAMGAAFSYAQKNETETNKVVAVFDITAAPGTAGPYTITLDMNGICTKEAFVALYHINTLVNVTWNGTKITFTVDTLSPFTVIAKVASSTPTSPATGETLNVGYIAAAVVLAAGAVWFFSQSRKVKA